MRINESNQDTLRIFAALLYRLSNYHIKGVTVDMEREQDFYNDTEHFFLRLTIPNELLSSLVRIGDTGNYNSIEEFIDERF